MKHRHPFRITLHAILCCCASLLAPANQAHAAPAKTAPQIPDLNWEPRSDWINVKTSGAKGDGIQDDTAAIQAALDKIQDGVTIYFPPGTYRITRTLQSPRGRYLGVTLLGHGRTTTLAWDGAEKGRMFWTNDGMPCSRYVGLTWDGRGKAAVGFDHSALTIYETEIRHQYEAFRNFTEAGIRVGQDQHIASAETIYDNCLFENCAHGISLRNFNDLDHTITACEFRKCGVGLYSGKGSNFYLRDSHFEGSTRADIDAEYGESGSSVRRCTSQGSTQFLVYKNWVAPLTIQDCHVDGWTSPSGAVVLDAPPVVMFDCVFTHPPTKEAPVRLVSPAPADIPIEIVDAGQRLIVSNNKAEGCTEVIQLAPNTKLYEVPAGVRKGVVRSAAQTFLNSKAAIPTKVFDIMRDFGAKGDGVADDTVAIKSAIAAARKYGKGAIAYVPGGHFIVSETLELSGSNYTFGGSGYRTALIWRGKTGGTTISIHDPDHITLENIAVGHHDTGVGDNAIDIQQTGTGKPSFITYDRVWVFGMYQMKPLDRGLRLVNLGKGDRINFREFNGNTHFIDSADATAYLGLSYEGTILLEGKSLKRDGFIGGSARLGTITDPALWVKDNHSIAISDFYVESSQHYIRLEGDANLPAGRVTLQGAKFELGNSDNNGLEVNNYKGELALGPYQFYVGNPQHRFVQKGEASFDMTLWASSFYSSEPVFTFAPSGKRSVVGCYGVGTEKGKGRLIADAEVNAGIPHLTRAMDDLRRIGEVDFAMNYAGK